MVNVLLFNTSRPEQNDQRFTDDIFGIITFDEKFRILIQISSVAIRFLPVV